MSGPGDGGKQFLKRAQIVRVALLAVGLLSRSAAAQELPPDAGIIARALDEERRHIAALRVELERRAAALDALQRQLVALSPVPAAPPPPPTPPLAAVSPAVPPVSQPRFDFYGESKVRYETLHQDVAGCGLCPNRKRGRLRLRFGATGRVSRDFTGAFGLGIGEVSDANTVYANLGNKFSRKVATWDRGYVEFHPEAVPWLKVTAGKFPYTWLRSSMTFDVDFFPEGISQRVAFARPQARVLKNVGLELFELLVTEQPADLHTTIAGGQFSARLALGPAVTSLVALTAMDVRRPEYLLRGLLGGIDTGVRNTNAVVIRDGQAFHASGFGSVNAIVETTAQTRWPRWPVTVGLEYQHNLRAASTRDTGASLRVEAGRSQRRGDWELGWHLFRVEEDAILSAFGESDWRAPSNVLQHRFALNRMVSDNVQLSYTWYRGRTLDGSVPGALLAPGLPASARDPWMNRMYFDLAYRY